MSAIVREDGQPFPLAERSTNDVVVADGKVWQKVRGARPWRPQVSAVLVGNFISKSTRPGDNGTVYGVITIQTEDNRAHTLTGVVITGLVESSGVEYGAKVRIVYLGQEQSGAGRTYRNYEMFVERKP